MDLFDIHTYVLVCKNRMKLIIYAFQVYRNREIDDSINNWLLFGGTILFYVFYCRHERFMKNVNPNRNTKDQEWQIPKYDKNFILSTIKNNT